MRLLKVNEELSRFIFKPPWVGSEAASLSAAHVRKMWCTEGDLFDMLVKRNPCLLWNLNFHSLPVAWGSWEPQHAPPVLDYGCFMPIPSLQLQKKSCLMQRSGGFGHGVVVSKICYNLLIVLLCDCCKLLAFVGWKRGCQPFSCPRSQNVTHCRKEIYATCLSKESIPAIPLGYSKHPLLTRSRFLRVAAPSASSASCRESCPSLRCS